MNQDNSDFFDDEEVRDIAESHIERVLSLEDSESKKIMRMYDDVRKSLRDRLEMIPGGTFTAQKMRGTLVQVESALVEMQKRLTSGISGSSETMARTGIENLISEITKWNKEFTGAVIPINLSAIEVALDTKNFLFNRYESSLDAYTAMTRARMASSLTESVIAQDNYSDVVSNLSKTFMGEQWKLQQITRTELHNVYNQGKLNGMKDLVEGNIPDLLKTLYHPMDSRTGKDSVRLSQNNPVVPVDEPFIEYSTGKRLEYMAPPNRPNDRAILIPYRKVWAR